MYNTVLILLYVSVVYNIVYLCEATEEILKALFSLASQFLSVCSLSPHVAA